MAKRISLSDEDYYLFLRLKGEHRTESLAKIIEAEVSRRITIKPENQITTKPECQIKPVGSDLCVCGHPEAAHDTDGCLGNGCECDCKEYRKAEAQSKGL